MSKPVPMSVAWTAATLALLLGVAITVWVEPWPVWIGVLAGVWMIRAMLAFYDEHRRGEWATDREEGV